MKKQITTVYLSALVAVLIACGFVLNGTTYATGTVYVLQDFENTSFPSSGWSVSNTSAYDWVRTTYCSGYGVGTSCICADFYDYASGTFDLMSVNFAATTANDTLSFDHAYAPASSENDQLAVYTSNNGGSTWTLLIQLAGGTAGPLTTAPATQHLFVPNAGQWATKKYVLPVGTNKVKFSGITAFGNNLYLDNIKVGIPYSNDVGVNSITQPKWAITPQGVTPKATVRNYGTSTQSFSVTMTINPGGYSNTQSVTSLAPGQSTLVTFSNNTFASTGAYTIKAFSTLGSDQNMSNDTITNTLQVTVAPRNIVLEMCTGTWCQWCPCGDNEAHNLVTAYPNTIQLAYHGGSDPWATFNGSGIINGLGFAGYPSALNDRRLGLNSGWGSIFTDGEYRYMNGGAATVNLAMTSLNFNNGTGLLTVNYNATALQSLSGQYKVTYVIVEDNLIYAQTGNAYCTGSSTWVHNGVVRTMINGMSGDNVNSGTWNNGQSYPLSTNTTLTPSWVSSNCKVIAFVFQSNGTLATSVIQQGISNYINPVGIINQNTEVPKTFSLSQNYPNPFNPMTNVHFSVPKDGNVSFKIYNTLGQLVATYMDGFMKAGTYNAEIDGTNMASGVYFYTLIGDGFIQTKKMILTK